MSAEEIIQNVIDTHNATPIKIVEMREVTRPEYYELRVEFYRSRGYCYGESFSYATADCDALFGRL